MTARVDSRDVLERLADLVEAVDFELSHPDEPVQRCECGATLLKHLVSTVWVCAGCESTPTYWLTQDRIHPAPVLAQSFSGDWERGVPLETSAGKTQSAKGADAPDGSSVSLGSGVLGRVGYALRSLKSSVNWGLVWGTAVSVAFWTWLGYLVGMGL